MIPTLARLRRFAVTASLVESASLQEAVNRLGFVQADPIRAPARAQDLTLRHRVHGYRAGDLERRYASLDIEEDFFVNYGFVPRAVHALMHPRARLARMSPSRKKSVEDLLAFVRARGVVHPREVDAHFARGSVVNYWGGSSSATTHLLDDMHYRGLLRVVRRDAGIRLYAPHQRDDVPVGVTAERRAKVDALIDVAVRKYAPVPAPTLAWLVNRLRLAVPQWRVELKEALARAKRRLSHARAEGVDWYWPADEGLPSAGPAEQVRLLAPFDPVVWDRRRFELFWGWAYRFEAYTPASRRRFGYYALPMLWRDRVIGWANLGVEDGRLDAQFGYVSGHAPRTPQFRRELDAEIGKMERFLRLQDRAGLQLRA
ncbi:MAG: crosslink repair DNA glycosylase YcaQ family protein [Vicinamibacterales bacterium]